MGTIPASENVFPIVRLDEGAAPGTPPAGEVHLYAKSDGLLYWKDDAGDEYPAGAGTPSLPALDDLTDVDAPTPSTDDVLTWDGADWVAQAPTGGGGGAVDRTIPAGGTLYTFDAALSGWTITGSPDVATAEHLGDLLRITEATAGGSHVYSVHRALPGALPRTITARFAGGLAYQNYQGGGICICEAAPGDTQGFGIIFDGSRQWSRRLFPTPTSHTTGTNYGVSTDARTDFWARMVINSATDVDYLASLDGIEWYEYVTADNPGFTPTNFGIAAWGFGSPAAIDAVWLHST